MSIIEKVKSIANRRTPKTLMVHSATQLTPNMRRVTLKGEAVKSFPADAEGAYIKLLFEQANRSKPIMRTYTVAKQRVAQGEIDVDFMLHKGRNGEAHGIAAPWSLATQPGDKITIAGPGPAKFINLDAEYFFLAADMTALPALAANLQRLPQHAQGKVFIEVLSEADQQSLVRPEGIELIWVINNKPGSNESPLFHELQQADWPEGKVAAWVACEFKTMKKIRNYLKLDRGVEKSHLYISSYWKKGNTEEQHKEVKQADAKENGI